MLSSAPTPLGHLPSRMGFLSSFAVSISDRTFGPIVRLTCFWVGWTKLKFCMVLSSTSVVALGFEMRCFYVTKLCWELRISFPMTSEHHCLPLNCTFFHFPWILVDSCYDIWNSEHSGSCYAVSKIVDARDEVIVVCIPELVHEHVHLCHHRLKFGNLWGS